MRNGGSRAGGEFLRRFGFAANVAERDDFVGRKLGDAGDLADLFVAAEELGSGLDWLGKLEAGEATMDVAARVNALDNLLSDVAALREMQCEVLTRLLRKIAFANVLTVGGNAGGDPEQLEGFIANRQSSGRGQFVEATLFETGLAVMHPHASNYFFTGKTPVPTGNQHPSLSPYESFKTRDGLIFIGVGNDGTFRKLCAEIGREDLAADPRFTTNRGRIENRNVLRIEMEKVFANLDRDALCDRLLAAGLPAGPIQSIDKALESPHAKARGDVVAKDWYKGVASPVRFERNKASLRYAPPRFSEHAVDILKEIGLGEDEIAALTAEGVVCKTRKGA